MHFQLKKNPSTRLEMKENSLLKYMVHWGNAQIRVDPQQISLAHTRIRVL